VSDSEESLLTFPCDFHIKVMGKAEPGFDAIVAELVRRHAPDLSEGAITSRASSGGKWISVTVVLKAESKAQLDAIYLDLTAHEKIVMAL